MNTAKENAWIAGVAYGVSSEAGHMWTESKYDHASALYMDANFEEAFKIDDASSVFHYKPIATLAEWLSSSMSQEHNNDYKCKGVDICITRHGLFSIVSLCLPYVPISCHKDSSRNFGELGVSSRLRCEDEITNLTMAVCLPKNSQDHIMDVDFAKKVPELDFKFCDDMLNFGNSRSEINSQENDAQQVNKSNDEPYTQPNEVNQVNKLTEAEVASTVCLSTNGPFGEEKVRPRQKRLCHLPKKYAEESPILKPLRGRPKKYFTRSSTDKDLGGASQKKYNVKFSKRKAAKVTGKLLQELDSDDDYNPCATPVRTRHCNKQWKLDEVVKLVDGITHFGLGRWTAIQKTFFKSSRRTPTDVRDKWRNLVNSSCGVLKNKRKRSGSSLPNTITERVRELAKIIPECRS